MAVFAFGETLMQPTIPAICNDLAGRPHPRPLQRDQRRRVPGRRDRRTVVAGLLLDHDLAWVYVGLMVLGCLSICAMAGALERRISATVNGVAADEPVTTPTERS